MYILLFLFWLILNGRVTAELLLIGLALTAGIGVFVRVLFGYGIRKDLLVLRKVPLFLLYVPVLCWEVIKACFQMFGFIIGEKRNIEPVLVTFTPGLKTELGRFVLANSITLTPGTITIDVKDDTFTVHCLRKDFLDVSENSVFIRWARRLEA